MRCGSLNEFQADILRFMQIYLIFLADASGRVAFPQA